jgi:BlaI family transcriptional regulator, penicillinase repressor
MEALWTRGRFSIPDIQEAFAAKRRPAYTTVPTTVYGMEENRKIVRRVKRFGHADIFKAAISREQGQGTLIDQLLAWPGSGTRPVIAHFVKTGNLTLEDIKEPEERIRELSQEEKSK